MTKNRCSQIAWVTGAGRGIGKAVTLLLQNEGWVIAASSRTSKDLDQLVSENELGNLHAYPLDVTDPVATKLTIKRIENELGNINLVVLNAGTFYPSKIDSLSEDHFRNLVEVNLMGTVNGLSSMMPRFIERKGGNIAVVASLAGYRGLPNASAYGATKAALINMCEAIYPKLKENNVHIHLINPGFVKTPLTDKNDFHMPFLISAEDAATRILKGIKNNQFEICFPRRFALIMSFLRIIPNRFYFFLINLISK